MKRFFGAILIAVCFGANAQTDIKVMSYNVLNFPTGGDIANRQDTLAKILDYYMPDLFLLQELKSAQGLASLLETFNAQNDDEYLSGTYVSQVSNPSTSWPLQQNLIYNTRLFGLASEEVITTPYRDVNYFKLYLQDLNLESGQDSTFLHVYVTHLKSSQGSENEELRYQMAQVIHDEMAALPPESAVVLGGDFNVYSSTEPAYQELLSANTANDLLDPIDMPGEWHSSSFPNKEILTQSTRLQSLSDGAGGGMDDRFDFVLLSEHLMDGNGAIAYQNDDYVALGNNGGCYNFSLLNCINDNPVPADIVRALYYMSDHLPVVFSLQTEVALRTENLQPSPFKIYPNPAVSELSFSAGSRVATYQVLSATGLVLAAGKIETDSSRIRIETLPQGMYFLSVQLQNGQTHLSRWIKE